MSNKTSDRTPWHNTIYLNEDDMSGLVKVDGNKASYLSIMSLDYPQMDPYFEGQWTFGDFGEARQEVKEAAGGHEDNYNIEMDCGGFWKMIGILSEDGSSIHFWGFTNKVECYKALFEEDYEKLKNSRETIKECSVPYPMQPGNPGKVVWISGPDGVGKSTTCQLMAKEAGFVYYEADCIFSFLNPFVPLDVENPTLASAGQKPLCGYTPEAVSAILKTKVFIEALCLGVVTPEMYDDLAPFVNYMVDDIKYQHKRVGGNFAVAAAIPSRKYRDAVREYLPHVVFIMLKMTKEAVGKRLKDRHGESLTEEMSMSFLTLTEMFEGPAEDEENTYEIEIKEDMTPKDVLEKVLSKLN